MAFMLQCELVAMILCFIELLLPILFYFIKYVISNDDLFSKKSKNQHRLLIFTEGDRLIMFNKLNSLKERENLNFQKYFQQKYSIPQFNKHLIPKTVNQNKFLTYQHQLQQIIKIQTFHIYVIQIYLNLLISMDSNNCATERLSNSNQPIQQQKIDQQFHMDQIEQRVRRSSRIKDSSSFRQFLAYASMVRDEDQVYAYMQENQIGIEQPQFWSAKLTMLKNKCEYKEFIKVVKQLNKNHELKKHPKYWHINQIKDQLQKYLQRMLRTKAKNKRSARQYQMINYADVEKQTRKFGKIQVYVDPDCRMEYRLEDLVEFVTKRLADQCEVNKNIYLREISTRPLSFLGKNKDRINKMSQQVLGMKANDRKSQARKTEGRISIVGRQSNKLNVEHVQTPDFKKKSISKQNRQKRKLGRSSISHLDSIQILKHYARKSITNSQKSKKKRQQFNPQFETVSDASSVKKENMRKSPQNFDDIFSEPDLSFQTQSIFSFGENQHIPSTEQKKQKKRPSKSKKQQKGKLIQKNSSCNDYAFIEQSQMDVIGNNNNKKNTKQSLDLQNVIKQIQMQKYESQTFSQIDSNKQNNFLSSEQDCLSLNYGVDVEINCHGDVQRKKFDTVKKDLNKNKSAGLFKQKQMYIYHDNSSSEQNGDEANDSSRLIYKQLLFYLEDDNKSGGKADGSLNNCLLSEKKNKKRISRISQQKSYSFSETKPKSKSD